jgi:hypothetical protein
METYQIIDLTQVPNITVPGKESVTMEEAIIWINESGGDCPLCNYTVLKNEV